MLARGSTALAAAVTQRCVGCMSIIVRKHCRSIASSAATSGVHQSNAPLVHLEQGSALKEVEQLDLRAQNLYREHPLAFYNFPVESLEWRATTNMLGVFSTLANHFCLEGCMVAGAKLLPPSRAHLTRR